MARPKSFDKTKALESAMHVFWCQGYESTSISDLTAAMSLKPGSIYNTFQDKHSLYLEALDHYQQTAGICVFDALRTENAGKAGLIQFFDDLIDWTVTDTDAKGCMLMNAMLERLPLDKDVLARAEAANTGGTRMFADALRQARADGDLKEGLDIDQTAQLLLATMYGLRVLGKSVRNRQTLQNVANAALQPLFR